MKDYNEYDFYECDDSEKLPLKTRLRVILAASALAWAFIFVAAVMAYALVG